MNRFLGILRDPIWQVVGVLISLIIAFISTSEISINRKELSVIPFKQTYMASNWLPSEHYKLLFKGAKKDMEKAILNYYVLINESSESIQPSDFIESLEIRPSNVVKRVISVESCSKPLEQSCSIDDSSSSNEGSYVPIKWVKNQEKWIADPLLFNKGDRVCVLVVSEFADNTKSALVSPVEWYARISNIQLKVYSDPQVYSDQHKDWKNYFIISVTLYGIGVYWFAFLQCVIFISTAALAIRGNWLDFRTRKGMLQCIPLVILSTTTSEILVDIFINKRPSAYLHPVIWPLLAIHTLLIAYLVYRAMQTPPAP